MLKLPILQRDKPIKTNKTKTVYQRANQRLSVLKSSKSNSISKILKEVRSTMKNQLYNERSLQKQKKNQDKIQKRKESFANRKQKKLYYFQTTSTKENQIFVNDNLFKFTKAFQTINIQQISTLEKPPHRYKSALCYDNEKLYLYAGIGCQQNLKLVFFDLQTKKWTFPLQQKLLTYRPTTPLSGHSFTSYKGKGYIYGGSCNDITNQLSIVNFNTLKFTEGQKCQYRRKDHAVTMISKFMIVQGGIQSNQVMNNMYYYDTENNVWGYFARGVYDLPFLSHHSMTSTFPTKTKKKVNYLSDISDPIFIFGGKDKKGNSSNTLYKIFFDEDSVSVLKVQFLNGPQRRFSCTFHFVGNNAILLYGGKRDDSQQSYSTSYQDDQSQKQQQCSDIYSFHTQKNEWTKYNVTQSLRPRYGMASTCNGNKIFLYGGFIDGMYSDANITILTTWNPEMLKSKSNLGTKSFLSGQKYS